MVWRGSFHRSPSGGFVQGRTGDRNSESRRLVPVGDFTPVFIFFARGRLETSTHWDEQAGGWQPVADDRTDFAYGQNTFRGDPRPELGLQNWEQDVAELFDAFRISDQSDWASVERARPRYRIFMVQPQHNGLVFTGTVFLEAVFRTLNRTHLVPRELATTDLPGVTEYVPYTMPTFAFDWAGANSTPPPDPLSPGVNIDLVDNQAFTAFFEVFARSLWEQMAGVRNGVGNMQIEFLQGSGLPIHRRMFIILDTLEDDFVAESAPGEQNMHFMTRRAVAFNDNAISTGVIGNRWREIMGDDPVNRPILMTQITDGTGRWVKALRDLIIGRAP